MTHRRPEPRHAAPLSAILVLSLSAGISAFVGCGGGRHEMVEVSGKVTFDGGPPPAAGTIVFKPKASTPGGPNRSGRARFSTDGNYTVTSFREGDGLAPGEYEVEVSCFSGPPKIGAKDPFGDVSYIAKEYAPETVSIEESEASVSIDFDVPLKK
jgi:hypothetical protein